MTWQNPTVGRVVHYVSYGTPGGEHKSECRAAMVTAVTNATTVDLCVMNPTGLFFNQGALFVGENGPGYDTATGAYPGGTWHWPERV